jgi:uncharacterized membrane protein
MIENLRTTDVHPPLYHSVLWVCVGWLGDGELALRAPSIAAGLALIPMLFVAGRAMFDRRTGLIAAAFGSVAPILIWYSEEARMYALVTLLALAATAVFARAVSAPAKARARPARAATSISR